jgi:hypothetical protein
MQGRVAEPTAHQQDKAREHFGSFSQRHGWTMCGKKKLFLAKLLLAWDS